MGENVLSLDPKLREELREFVYEQLRILKEIVLMVKDYIDFTLMDANMDDLDQVDKSFYYAFILEVSRSIFINWSIHRRRKLEQELSSIPTPIIKRVESRDIASTTPHH